MTDARTTVGSAVGAATTLIDDAGIASPRRVAIRLWRELGAAPDLDALIHHDRPLPDATVLRYRDAATRLAAGEPMQYVVGRAGFRRLTLLTDRRALIPRPETEGLVGVALEKAHRGRAADVGTGSGAIALALRDEGAFDEVIGIDLSGDALDLARANAAATGLDVTWAHGDLVGGLAPSSIDLLVSNPPYLTTAEYDALDQSVRDHEPAMALVSGHDGLAATRRLLEEGIDVVVPGGWIALEIDFRRAHGAAEIASAAGWSAVAVQEDLFGRARFLLARRETRS